MTLFTRDEIIANALDYAHRANAELESTPYYLDVELAKKVITFISILKHTGGEIAGTNFQLLHFQIKFLVDVICTKKRSDHKRRYTTAMLMLPRKNGKTELIAGVLNYFLFADKEKGKEIYCAANETDQAKILYMATETMIKQNKTLESKCTRYKSTRTIEKSGEFEDFVKVLTSNADTKDGLKPYVVVYDELHAAKNSELYTVLEEGMAHRTEPLFIIISTAGYNHQGIMKQKYEYAKKVKDGVIKDDSFYSMIFEPDDTDDWENEDTWVKCNPALGYGVKLDYLRNKFIKAQHSGEDEVAFKTKHLNMWTNSSETWIKLEDWQASFKHDIDEEYLIGRECYAGLDLASTTDIAAFVMIFPKDNDECDVLCRFWIPSESKIERSRRDKVPYISWVNSGYIQETDGNVIDYAFIEAQIKEDCQKFDVKEIAYDRWNASSLVTNLDNEGISQMTQFGQGFASMSAPTKQIETLVLQKKINHGNNPVLTWMMSNVTLKRDPADNIKIDKSKSSEKVDGMVALAMAFGIKLSTEPPKNNVYEERGMRIL